MRDFLISKDIESEKRRMSYDESQKRGRYQIGLIRSISQYIAKLK